MDYQIAVREDKGLEVGTPPSLIQGEKGVDRLVFTLPDPYRGMALDDFSFTANLESAAGCHKLAAARSERVEGAVRCVLELNCSLEGLRDEVLLRGAGRAAGAGHPQDRPALCARGADRGHRPGGGEPV